MSLLLWGPYQLGRRFAPRHFLATGTVGSGKTTLIDSLMRSVFEGAAGNSCRALVYDPNQDMVSKLYGCGVSERRFKILNPFDVRCSFWEIAKDVTDVLSAQQLASILIPDAPGSSAEGRFFDDACRDVLSVVIQVFVFCVKKPQWTLGDVLLAVLFPENLEYILSFQNTRDDRPFPAAARVWSTYFDRATTDDRTRSNIRASLNARLSVFEPVAAAWSDYPRHIDRIVAETTADYRRRHGEEPLLTAEIMRDFFESNHRFSLTDWVAEGSNTVLVLGNDESARAAIDPINRAIFSRAAELLLAQRQATPEETTEGLNQTWFFLDEIRDAGQLDKLNPLISKGRSKGACVVLSFQDIDGLRSVYGKEKANEIVANCNNVALLKTSSESTAQWCSNMFGKFLVMETDTSTGISGAQISSSQTEKMVERSAVYAGDFLYLPLPSDESGLVGYFRDADSSAEDPQRRRLDWRLLNERRLPQSNSINYWPSDRTSLWLEGWTDEDLLERLGIEFVATKPKREDDARPEVEEEPAEKLVGSDAPPPAEWDL